MKDVPNKNRSHQTKTVYQSNGVSWLNVVRSKNKTLFVNTKNLRSTPIITVNRVKTNYFLPLIKSIHEKIGFTFKMVQRSIPAISFKIF